MASVPPDASSICPNIPPMPTTVATNPNVPPNPFCIAVLTLLKGIPEVTPKNMAVISSDRKGCNFTLSTR